MPRGSPTQIKIFNPVLHEPLKFPILTVRPSGHNGTRLRTRSITQEFITMAMANSLCYAGPFPIKTPSKQSPLQLPGACVVRRSLPYLKFVSRPASSSPPAVVVAAASTVEAEPQAKAPNPPKVLPFRVGHGFDLHRLEPGYPLIIGGINIPHDRGCEAHSDGDVLLHCVVDAILGALGLPDIGQIFPDTDPKWKGAPSSVFMKEAVRLMHEAGYELGNLDSTLILQRPKLSPHKEAIRANLCELLGADPAVVNLKAKTHEKVDSLGENRSIAAHTVVLLVRK